MLISWIRTQIFMFFFNIEVESIKQILFSELILISFLCLGKHAPSYVDVNSFKEVLQAAGTDGN